VCGYKNIWGHGQVWNGGRSIEQTNEPSEDERDRNPAFYLFRFSRYSVFFSFIFPARVSLGLGRGGGDTDRRLQCP
jgi:hypothetical protein